MVPSGSFARLISALNGSGAPVVVIQPHDDPDHDAVAAAYGLYRLLDRAGFSPRIMHRGQVRSHSLKLMIAHLGIVLERVCEPLEGDLANAPCVIVDGSPVYSNARPLTNLLLGVIDHHPNPGAISCPFMDIRTSYGACASIVSDYWMDASLDADRGAATALLMGIQIDTDFLSRRVSPADLEAHHRLFFRADWEFVTHVVKASLSLDDLPAFEAAVRQSHIAGCLFFTIVPMDCTQELISIMADFFLRLKEISLTVIVEKGGGRYHVSVRSRSSDISAAYVIRRVLVGIGKGGGHDHMAGGIIEPDRFPGEDALFARFIEAAETAQENQ